MNRKFLIWPFITLFCLLFFSCKKNEVRLSFNLAEDVSTPCRILYYEESETGSEQFRETVADIRGGKGNFRLPAIKPVILYFLPTSGDTPSLVIYAMPGEDIKITGEGNDISQWHVEGNKVTKELTAWHNENIGLLRANDTKELNEAIAEFVKGNPASQTAIILLYLYYDRRDNPDGFRKLKSELNNETLNNQDLMHALSVGDQFTGMRDGSTTLPKQIVMVGESGYADTLSLSGKSDGVGSKSKGMLLLFRDSRSGSQSKIPLDSIKEFLEHNKEIRAADFFAETDSFAWRREIKRDTIEGLHRFWMPLGLADTTAITIGVKRVPYIIVVDSLRKIRYRGDDWNKAVKNLKSLP